MTTRTFLASLFLVAALGLATPASAADSPVYELRIYTCNEGKLPDLLKRFRDHTCKLFEKHGMTNIGYWVPVEKADGADNTLIYIVSHRSRDAAKESWKAFGADHLVAGSDYPVLMAFETYRQTFHYIRESSLPAADVDRILHHNAQIVLGLPH